MDKANKMVVVGDGAVGKTCLLVSFVEDKFPEDYVPTVFDNYSTNMVVDKEVQTIDLWDTAGQEDYDRLRPLSYPDTNIFLICFSVVHRSSFDNIQTRWLPEITHYAPGVPMLLVGTKVDLREDPRYLMENKNSREGPPITKEEAEKKRKEWKMHRYVECSAKTQHGVKEVFETAVRISRNPDKFKDWEEDSTSIEKKKKCILL
ncbi:hypothetical protein FDP41_011163 [Naegleria fowleri]|uniref:Uncharacterized protein n=1 Tax=Naegleria fowleri TaxID=5763 RepID=A0A6A5CCW4_NAEFO|nr:uncharacterized protein FDP41_011163 [Naegleria fowleri]KAF0983185.1 hypothetical protein FDP41_011163 [Naegleria fowleri]